MRSDNPAARPGIRIDGATGPVRPRGASGGRPVSRGQQPQCVRPSAEAAYGPLPRHPQRPRSPGVGSS